MQPSNSDSLSVLIQRGRDISVSTQYGVHAGSEDDAKLDVPTRFMQWKDDVRSWLAKNNFQDEAEFFDEADEAPVFLVGGYAYGNPLSPESRERMEQVRVALSTKLKVLRSVRKKSDNPTVAQETASTQSAPLNPEYKTNLKIRLKFEQSDKGEKLFIQLFPRKSWIEIGLHSSGKSQVFLRLYNLPANISLPHVPVEYEIIALFDKAIKPIEHHTARTEEDSEKINKIENQIGEIQRSLTPYIKIIWRPNFKNKRYVRMIIDKKN